MSRLAAWSAIGLAVLAAPARADLGVAVETALRGEARLRVYDWVEFQIEGGRVTLTGTVSLSTLGPELERRAREAPGVAEVVNRIEPPVEARDDTPMRVNAYWRIYGNAELRRYAKDFDRPSSRVRRPDGSPRPVLIRPIHIVVQDGAIVLHGEVEQGRDAEIAERAAWEVLGVRSVENRLLVVSDNTEERQAPRGGPDPWWSDVSSALTPSLRVENPSGSVRVRTAANEAVLIRKQGRDRPVDDGDVVVDRLQRKMRIRATPLDGARLDLDIDLPYGHLLEIETVDGDIDIEGLFRRASLKTGTGQIDVRAPWSATRFEARAARRPPTLETPEEMPPPAAGPDAPPRPGLVWTLVDGRPAADAVYGEIHVEAEWPDALRLHSMPIPRDSPVELHTAAPGRMTSLFRSVSDGLRARNDAPGPFPEDEAGFERGFAHFSADARLVDLAVAVMDAEGRPIANLGPDDFEILESGVPQTVRTVEDDRAGFNLVLLLDCSTSTLDSRATLIQAARQFAGVARPGDRVAVYVLADSYLRALSPLTSDHDELIRRIDEIPPLAGGTPLYDGIVLAYARELAKRRWERNALVVLSDGMDNQLLPAVGRRRPSKVAFEDLRRAATEMNALIYPIYLDESGSVVTFRDLPFKRVRDLARSNLEELARAAGGRLFRAASLRSLEPVYDQVAAELRSIYRLSYTPRDQDFDGAWREVEIRVRRNGARARSRPGYYAW